MAEQLNVFNWQRGTGGTRLQEVANPGGDGFTRAFGPIQEASYWEEWMLRSARFFEGRHPISNKSISNLQWQAMVEQFMEGRHDFAEFCGIREAVGTAERQVA